MITFFIHTYKVCKNENFALCVKLHYAVSVFLLSGKPTTTFLHHFSAAASDVSHHDWGER